MSGLFCIANLLEVGGKKLVVYWSKQNEAKYFKLKVKTKVFL